MWMERRGFMRAVMGAAITGTSRWNLFAANEREPGAENTQTQVRETVIDARGFQRPVNPSSMHLGGKSPAGEVLRFVNLYLERSGKSYFPIAGEFHYTRFPVEGWGEELCKIKAGGINTVSTYVFRILHEMREGAFDWSGRKNLRALIELCQKAGLAVILRVGPFAHGEMRNRGRWARCSRQAWKPSSRTTHRNCAARYERGTDRGFCS